MLLSRGYIVNHLAGVPGLRANVAGRSGDPARCGGAGKLELTEVPRSKTVAERIPEGFRPAASGRVAPIGMRAAEPWHTRLYSLAGMACGVGVGSETGTVAALGGVTPFLNGRSSSE